MHSDVLEIKAPKAKYKYKEKVIYKNHVYTIFGIYCVNDCLPEYYIIPETSELKKNSKLCSLYLLEYELTPYTLLAEAFECARK